MTATETETMMISKREFTTVMNNLEINKEDLESLIGSLLHLQSKLRKQKNVDFDNLSNTF